LHVDVSRLGLRFHNIEPELKVIEHGDKVVDRFLFAFNNYLARLDLVCQSCCAQHDAIKNGTWNGHIRVGLRRMSVDRITQGTFFYRYGILLFCIKNIEIQNGLLASSLLSIQPHTEIIEKHLKAHRADGVAA
jgi:hypothetical protein